MKSTLSPAYQYEVTETESGQLITLLQVATGRTKEFPYTARSPRGLDLGMSSMTEDTCKGFFGKK